MNVYLAIDFGGGSGRVMAATIQNKKMKFEEIHRFQNRQVKLGNHLYWDFLSLFEDMKQGIRMAVNKGYKIKSIGIDTWGVDFGLIDAQGNLLGNPVCYRDQRTDGLPEELFANDAAEHYAEAGIQMMSINSLYQLYSMKKSNDATLSVADKLLFMPDLFSYFLTGEANVEYSIASTSELLDAKTKDWNWSLIDKIGFPRHLFGKIVMPGTFRGKIKKEVCDELEIDYEVEVIAVGSHDTASAVYAVPYKTENHSQSAFLSSGTWSLLGIELDQPILTEEARVAGFTNEGAVGGKIRFLQNITGLWILQRLMAEWKKAGENVDYQYLMTEADKVGDFSVIDVDNNIFQNPLNMQQAIVSYCQEHHLQVPHTQGEFVRCVLQSLAARYKKAITNLNHLLPKPVEQLHIIGGGSRNWLLNRLTEEALGIPVIAGPVEATTIGNILVQAMALKDINNKNEVEEII